MKTKISGVYKITNNITGDCYIGSSRNIKHRWAAHKCPSTWKICPSNPLYIDMQKYGLNNFKFEIIEETIGLRKREQYWINQLNPSYNNYRANGIDIERYNEYQKNYKKECNSRLCLYESEILTFGALIKRFQKQGIPHSTLEAKKYLLEE